eukprot:scaffold1199_cov265-Pinguiococcus_pyrenoidosus.AAC.38
MSPSTMSATKSHRAGNRSTCKGYATARRLGRNRSLRGSGLRLTHKGARDGSRRDSHTHEQNEKKRPPKKGLGRTQLKEAALSSASLSHRIPRPSSAFQRKQDKGITTGAVATDLSLSLRLDGSRAAKSLVRIPLATGSFDPPALPRLAIASACGVRCA